MRQLATQRKILTRAAFGGLLSLNVAALALSFSASNALALDDGDDTLIHSLSNLVSPDKTPEIDYMDRAPLVLPPTLKKPLPKPKLANGKPNPAWPNDPDVIRRQKEANESGLPIPTFDRQEIQKQRGGSIARLNDRAPQPTEAPQVPKCDHTCVATGAEIAANKYKSSFKETPQEQTAAVGQEPDREWLTEPPKGYRKVTRNLAAEPAAVEPPKSNPLAFWKWFN